MNVTTPIKPYIYTHSDVLDPPEDWQIEDMEMMYNQAIFRGNFANWSEMGCKKTSTGLWLIQRLWREFWETDKPNVWICTTGSGKGTFFNLAPHILEGWHIFNLAADGLYLLQDGKQFKIPKIEVVPERFDMPTLVVTHFNTFSKSNKNRFLEIDVEVDTPDGKEIHTVPITDPKTGAMQMMPWAGADYFVDREWDLCWIDEAHRIKEKDTKWTVIVKRSKDSIRTDTTGTGFINKPDEWWSLANHMLNSQMASSLNIKLVDPRQAQVTDSFWDFKEEFCQIDDSTGYERSVGVKPEKKDEFRALVRSFGPRRTLTEVMPHIKEPIFVARDVDLNATQRAMYNGIQLELQAMDQKGQVLITPNILAMLTRLRMISAATPEIVREWYDEKEERMRQEIKLVEPSSKLDAVVDILDELEWDEERKDKVVIFSNFTGTLDLLATRFNKANEACRAMGIADEYPYLWMQQKHNDQERYDMWKPGGEFESNNYRVFMSTLQLGGESISLTGARHIIFIDRSWSPKDNMQGIGRIRRPGQTGQPVVIHINARDTIDSYIHDVNNMKEGWFHQIFGKAI